MTDVLIAFCFSIVLIAFIGLFIYLLEKHKQQTDKLINALVSKKPEEFRDLNLADKVRPIIPPQPQAPDLMPSESMDEAQFDQLIASQLANE